MSITNGEAILDELEGDFEDFAPEETTDTYFVMVPLWVLEAVSGEAVKLYGILSTYLNPTSRIAWPSRQTLASRLGKSRPESIDRYLAELSGIGAVEVVPRYRPDGGRSSNAYRILRTPPRDIAHRVPPLETEEAPPLKTAEELKTITNLEDRESSLRSDSRPATGSIPVIHKKPTTVDIPTGEALTLWGAPGTELEHRARDYDAFDEFWAAYPRKDDKKKARTAYAKALREASPSEILAGARRYAEDPNRDPAYTKYAGTWLNAGAWANGPLPPRRDSRNTQERMEDTARLTGSMVEGWQKTFRTGEPGGVDPRLAIDSTRAS
ncbi:RepA-like replication initiator [Arthrobacter phage Lilmac1015]|uniref:RepA-like replication initiator n=1 Tax=Arthrobacter phage Lilmac1015 TaxID=2912653 RepID=A0AA49BQ46_9CAUD|nr:RepA-like replication initiator [Arthrobacter phage Lilmac1015]